MSLGIVVDSSAQVPASLVETYGLEVVPMTVVVDGEAYLEGVELGADEFYARFAERTPEVSTSQPSPALMGRAYDACAERGATEILSIHLTGEASGTLNSARLGAELSPVPVRVIDSGTSSFGVALCAWEAAEAAGRGAGFDEVVETVRAVANRLGNVFIVGGLDLARRGGRLQQSDGLAATPAGATPVLSVSGADLNVVGQAEDADAAVALMCRYISRSGRGLRVGVGDADAATFPMGDAMVAALEATDAVDEVIRYRVGPVVGSHTGPGTVGAWFYERPPGVTPA